MSRITRREGLRTLAAASALAAGCRPARPKEAPVSASTTLDPILSMRPLGFTWETRDPFLFTVHHDDRYPAGNERLGPVGSLAGRDLGQDFELRDGFRMYHGRVVPGFPQHPHRGFETVTVVRRGLIDHSDSLGAAGRYGGGDTQWMTAGAGIQHAEMFPLLNPRGENPLELFQIWVNLPAEDKLVPPHFSMFWAEAIPRHVERDAAGRATEITVIAGQLGDQRALPPPPRSWAARPDSDFAIWTLKLAPGATFTLPPARAGTGRSLYYFRGSGLRMGPRAIPAYQGVDLQPDVPVRIENGADEAELLLLQARPIGQPVVQHGPFVMNTREQIRQAILDYQRTQYGGWPWPSPDPVHGSEGRFARHADGRVDRPTRPT